MTDLGGGRGWLNAGPAASILRIDRQLGHRLQITEAGRSWAQQNAHYQTYLRNGWPIALSPDGPPRGNGPSVHQLGAAIDSDEAQRNPNTMANNGWRRTVYRNGVLVEPWHYEYFKQYDKHINDSAGSGGAAKPTQEDEEDMAKMKGASVRLPNGKIGYYILFNEESGFYARHSDVPAAYNNGIAGNWETNSWPTITEAHDKVFMNSLAQVRQGK